MHNQCLYGPLVITTLLCGIDKEQLIGYEQLMYLLDQYGTQPGGGGIMRLTTLNFLIQINRMKLVLGHLYAPKQ